MRSDQSRERGEQTHFSTFRDMVPSPSRGIFVTLANLTPCSSSNDASASQVIFTNFVLDDGNCFQVHAKSVTRIEDVGVNGGGKERTYTTSDRSGNCAWRPAGNPNDNDLTHSM